MEGFKIENNVLVKYNGKGGNVVIPDGVRIIGKYTFSNCNRLISVYIPNSVKEIGDSAFLGCSRLTSINIPDSVEEIGDNAFRGCDSLTAISIPDSVTKIGWSVFKGCSGLTSINIPNSVTEIGKNAFDGTRIKRQPLGHIAYKGFNADMTCYDFQYKEGETYICNKVSSCLNPLDCFNYYAGQNVVYHEVILEKRTGEINLDDSNIFGKKITIGRRLTLQEMVEIFNELNKE